MPEGCCDSYFEKSYIHMRGILGSCEGLDDRQYETVDALAAYNCENCQDQVCRRQWQTKYRIRQSKIIIRYASRAPYHIERTLQWPAQMESYPHCNPKLLNPCLKPILFLKI